MDMEVSSLKKKFKDKRFAAGCSRDVIREGAEGLGWTLEELMEALGDRNITICRELTKKYETAFRTTFSGALAHYENEEPRGECVIVVEGKSLEEIEKEKAAAWEDMTVEEHMDLYLEQGMDRKDAMKQVAKDRGISKRDVYQVLVERKL